jgi:hypothetical protein
MTLAGTWFICYSNFPMWLKGDKINPTFNYTITTRKEQKLLLDEVKYLKNGKQKTITGYDFQDKKDSASFVWRGEGILGLLKSKWRVALIDPKGQWAVIAFSRTLFTPEGVDIICRKPELSEETVIKIKNLMEKDEDLKKHLKSLKNLSPK